MIYFSIYFLYELISIHRFPTNPELKEKWLRVIGRPDWTPYKNSMVCSRHFKQTCFIQRSERRVLTKKSVPSEFVPVSLKMFLYH